MTAQQLQGQGVNNVLQTIIAAGVLWMASTLGDLSTMVELNEYRINQIEKLQSVKP